MKQPKHPVYYPVTQSMANLLPEESRARLEKYSNFQELLNAFAKVSDDLSNRITRYAANTNIETFMTDTIDLVYSIDKPNPIGEITADGITYTKSEKETIEEWAYDTEPDYFIIKNILGEEAPYYNNYDPITKMYFGSYIHPTIHVGSDDLICNTLIINEQYWYSTDDIDPDNIVQQFSYNKVTGYIEPYIKFSSANLGPIFFNNDINTPFDIVSVTLYGLDDNFMPQEEEIAFLYNTTIKSSKKWYYITSFKINLPKNIYEYAINNNGEINLSILPFDGTMFNFYSSYSPENGLTSTEYIEDKLFKYYDTENKQYVPLFYQINSGVVDDSDTLEQNGFIVNKCILDKDDVNRYIVVDRIYVYSPYSTKIISALPSSYSERFYIFGNNNKILWFDRRQQYSPAGKYINLRTQDPIVNIEYYTEYSEDNTNNDYLIFKGGYNRLRESQTIIRYRFIKININGQRDKILYEPSLNNEYNDNWIDYDNSYWTDYKPKNTLGFLSPVGKIRNEYGCGLLLEILTSTGTIHTDYIVMDNNMVYANTPFGDISNVYASNCGITEENNNNIIFVGNTESLRSYRIKFYSSTYFETDNKLLFLNKINVSHNNTPISDITTHNIFNELDQLAALIGVERYEGENNAILLKRLDHIKKYPINSTANGIANALAANTNIYNRYTFIESSANPRDFIYTYNYPILNIKSKHINNDLNSISINLTNIKFETIYASDDFNLSTNTSDIHRLWFSLHPYVVMQNGTNAVIKNNIRDFVGQNHFTIDHTTLKYNNTIYDISINNFEKVDSIENLSSGNKVFYYELKYNAYYNMYYAEVFTSKPLEYNDYVNVTAVNYPLFPCSRYHIVSAYDVKESGVKLLDETKIITNNDFIEKSETIYPIKWS